MTHVGIIFSLFDAVMMLVVSVIGANVKKDLRNLEVKINVLKEK